MAGGGVEGGEVFGFASRRLDGRGVHLRLAHYLANESELVARRGSGRGIYAAAQQLVKAGGAGNGHAHIHHRALHAVAHHRADAHG